MLTNEKVTMKSRPDLKLVGLLENIKFHFAFLFSRGFQIVSVIFVDQNYEDWQVTMATENCIIKIYNNRGTVGLALNIPQLYEAVGLLELEDLIYGVNGNESLSTLAPESLVNATPNLLQTAQLLEKHIDGILEKIRHMLLLLSFDDSPARSNKSAIMFQYN